jgi:hypothetical protein
MKALCGIDNIKLIEEDGAPCGKKVVINAQKKKVKPLKNNEVVNQ